MNSVYSKKYIKYKSKYLYLKQHGGSIERSVEEINEIINIYESIKTYFKEYLDISSISSISHTDSYDFIAYKFDLLFNLNLSKLESRIPTGRDTISASFDPYEKLKSDLNTLKNNINSLKDKPDILNNIIVQHVIFKLNRLYDNISKSDVSTEGGKEFIYPELKINIDNLIFGNDNKNNILFKFDIFDTSIIIFDYYTINQLYYVIFNTLKGKYNIYKLEKIKIFYNNTHLNFTDTTEIRVYFKDAHDIYLNSIKIINIYNNFIENHLVQPTNEDVIMHTDNNKEKIIKFNNWYEKAKSSNKEQFNKLIITFIENNIDEIFNKNLENNEFIKNMLLKLNEDINFKDTISKYTQRIEKEKCKIKKKIIEIYLNFIKNYDYKPSTDESITYDPDNILSKDHTDTYDIMIIKFNKWYINALTQAHAQKILISETRSFIKNFIETDINKIFNDKNLENNTFIKNMLTKLKEDDYIKNLIEQEKNLIEEEKRRIKAHETKIQDIYNTFIRNHTYKPSDDDIINFAKDDDNVKIDKFNLWYKNAQNDSNPRFNELIELFILYHTEEIYTDINLLFNKFINNILTKFRENNNFIKKLVNKHRQILETLVTQYPEELQREKIILEELKLEDLKREGKISKEIKISNELKKIYLKFINIYDDLITDKYNFITDEYDFKTINDNFKNWFKIAHNRENEFPIRYFKKKKSIYLLKEQLNNIKEKEQKNEYYTYIKQLIDDIENGII